MNWLTGSPQRLPAPWPQRITLVLVLVLVFFLYFGWWVTFEWLREAAWWIVGIIGAVFVLVTVMRRVLVERRELPAGKSSPSAVQDGVSFAAVIGGMLAWWIVSTYGMGTNAHVLPWEDHTLRVQGALCACAVCLLFPRHGVAKGLIDHPWSWVWAYSAFFGAIVMMIADTDYQHLRASPPIPWGQWMRWRCLNYALIVPYLLAGIAAANGCRIAFLCLGGVVGIVLLAAMLTLTGVPM